MSQISIELRRAVTKATLGTPTHHKCPPELRDIAKFQAQAFARSKLIRLQITEDANGLTFTAIGTLSSSAKYSEVDDLQVGESYLFGLPPRDHQNIRSNMAYRARTTGRMFSCSVEGDGLRVTRIDPDADAGGTPGPGPVRNKYGLGLLADQASVNVAVARAEHSRVRTSAHLLAVKTGWHLTCKAQADGSITVYRLVDGQMPPGAPVAASAVGRPTRQSKHGLERLETEREIRFTPATYQDARNLRVAVSTMALNRGWRLACRKQYDGSYLVLRLDCVPPLPPGDSDSAANPHQC